MRRTFLAFVIAPLVPAIVLIRDAGPAIALVYAYVLTFLFGVPVFLTLKRKKKESHICYLTCGAASAASVMIVIFLINGARDPRLLPLSLVLALVGAVEGLCFSAIRGNEKNTA